jgi:hypothetical protein
MNARAASEGGRLAGGRIIRRCTLPLSLALASLALASIDQLSLVHSELAGGDACSCE